MIIQSLTIFYNRGVINFWNLYDHMDLSNADYHEYHEDLCELNNCKDDLDTLLKEVDEEESEEDPKESEKQKSPEKSPEDEIIDYAIKMQEKVEKVDKVEKDKVEKDKVQDNSGKDKTQLNTIEEETASLRSKASINASSDWKTEVEIVRGIYADRIIRDLSYSDYPNRYFTLKFMSDQYLDIHESTKERLETSLSELTRKVQFQERVVAKAQSHLRSPTVSNDETLRPTAKANYTKENTKLADLKKSLDTERKDLEREILKEHYPYLKVSFGFTRRYPQMVLDIRFENNGGLDGVQIQEMYKITSAIMRENIGMPMLCITIDLIQQKYNEFQPKDEIRRQRIEDNEHAELAKYANEVKNKSWNLSNPGHWLSNNINSMLKKLPKNVKVVNIENILRADLVHKFERYRCFLQHKYLEGSSKHNRTSQIAGQWIQSEVVFHGTRAENVPSIVLNGLQVPGQEQSMVSDNLNVKVASGSRYGLGIYTSPNINFSLHYTRGSGRLLVLAVLPGRKFICNDKNVQYGGKCTPGYDSHQSEDNTELVLFKAAAVLPCYVIHYKYTNHISDNRSEDPVKYHDDPVLNWKLKKKKEQEDLKSRAMKTLGYGFGPAGKNFVVQAVYEAREIEEDLSSFQNTHEHQYQNDRGDLM